MFDREVWLEERGRTGSSNKRLLMVTELLTRRLHIGMSRDEIVELLGLANAEVAPSIWRYDLGPSAFGVDYEYLIITFDAQDRVAGFRLTRG